MLFLIALYASKLTAKPQAVPCDRSSWNPAGDSHAPSADEPGFHKMRQDRVGQQHGSQDRPVAVRQSYEAQLLPEPGGFDLTHIGVSFFVGSCHLYPRGIAR
jgi:hypothetical protein